jgi:hypothetical protein
MSDRLETLMGQIRALERELIAEVRKKEAAFAYEVRERKVRFTEEARRRHLKLRLGVMHYVRNSRFLVLATSPLIWICAVPIALADVIGTIYQGVCFPIYGIPKVRRGDYLVFDRHHLPYLNFFERVNCEYCAYVNGILAYFTEIAARTEQHWCPIKHAGCVKCAHSRYPKFIDFGDAEGYRESVERVRRSYGDLESPNPSPLRPPGPGCGGGD